MFNKLLTSDNGFYDIAEGINDLMKKILGPVLIVIGVLAVAYAIYLGVLYAKAEDAGKRKEVQGRLIGALIGAVIIIAGMTLCFSINWIQLFNSFQDDAANKLQEQAGGKTPASTIASLVRMMIR